MQTYHRRRYDALVMDRVGVVAITHADDQRYQRRRSKNVRREVLVDGWTYLTARKLRSRESYWRSALTEALVVTGTGDRVTSLRPCRNTKWFLDVGHFSRFNTRIKRNFWTLAVDKAVTPKRNLPRVPCAVHRSHASPPPLTTLM